MNHFRSKYATAETQTSELLAEEASVEQDEQLTFENAELVHFGLGRLGFA